MEQDARETTPGITRGQNVFYLLPHAVAAIDEFLPPVLARIEPEVAELQALVVTPDAESAAWVTAAAARLAGDARLVALPVTSARRALRLLRARPAQLVAGSPAELLSLVQGSALKVDGLRVLVLAWADALTAGSGAQALETLLADLPRETARVVVAAEGSEDVEALVERYARRPRRVGRDADELPVPVTASYVTVSAASRPTVLRRILDELDPASAAVVVTSDDSERVVRETLRALGYDAESGSVRVSRGEVEPGVEVAVLYDPPASAPHLQTLAESGARLVALVQPRQLAGLRALAAGGRIAPLTLPEAAARARHAEAAMRAELRDRLLGVGLARELMALEPLLEEFDGIEIAAAALRLIEEARRVAQPPAPSAPGASAGMSRLFVSVGTRDGARPGDLVGAITNEAGITSTQIGRIELRDTHSLVEVESAVAESVAAKITGVSVRGRRLQARVDRPGERPAPRGGDDRPRRSGPREGREGREGGPPRDRAPRGDRPARPARPRRDDDDRPRRPAPRPRRGE